MISPADQFLCLDNGFRWRLVFILILAAQQGKLQRCHRNQLNLMPRAPRPAAIGVSQRVAKVFTLRVWLALYNHNMPGHI
jgi:hypothetical protein